MFLFPTLLANSVDTNLLITDTYSYVHYVLHNIATILTVNLQHMAVNASQIVSEWIKAKPQRME